MDRKKLPEHLKELRSVILQEREAARALAVEDMLAFTEQKEELLKQMLSVVDSVEELSADEQELAESVHSENLRNAYFFWSALQWVRDSMSFISDQLHSDSYGSSGSIYSGGCSGALISGRI
ncbi:MAG: hypothetical protein R6X08_05220 [Desulfosalsimonadaceae bacterium]